MFRNVLLFSNSILIIIGLYISFSDVSSNCNSPECFFLILEPVLVIYQFVQQFINWSVHKKFTLLLFVKKLKNVKPIFSMCKKVFLKIKRSSSGNWTHEFLHPRLHWYACTKKVVIKIKQTKFWNVMIYNFIIIDKLFTMC